MTLDNISEHTRSGITGQPALSKLEPLVQTARRAAPWHLWLDKYAWVFAERVDLGREQLEKQRKQATQAAKAAEQASQAEQAQAHKTKARELRAILDGIPAGKACALRAAQELAAGSETIAAAHAARQRWIGQFAAQCGPARLRILELRSEVRLLLHLGRPNPLENVGLYADRTTGLPLIPGSAVKGVLSTWLHWLFPQESDPGDGNPARRSLAARILGSDAPGGSEHAGDVIFLGGFPAKPPALEIDLVNPHHDEVRDSATGAWTVSDATRLKPSPFLAVAPGFVWRFVFHARAGVPEAADLLDHTASWLTEAFTTLGIGAKTASGYGKFRPVDDPGEDAPRNAPALDLPAQVKNSFTWERMLKPQVQAWASAGNVTALDALRALAAQTLDRLKLTDFTRKLDAWIAAAPPPAVQPAPPSAATPRPAIPHLVLPEEMLKFRLLTDCFAGTALGQHAEMRVPPLRGQLRVWHRVLFGAGDCAEVWGSSADESSGGSRVAVQVRGATLRSESLKPTLPHKTNWDSERPVIPIGEEFTLKLIRLPACTDNQWNNARAAANLWRVIGSLGLRSRRAAGSVWPSTGAPADKTALLTAIDPLKQNGWHAALIGKGQGKNAEVLRATASDTVAEEEFFGAANPTRIPSPVRFKVIQLADGLCLLAVAPPAIVLADARATLLAKPNPTRWTTLGPWDHLF